MDFMASLPPEEKVILVGHSMGGNCIALAMERFPEKISAAVFAAALMPGPDLSFATIYEEVYTLCSHTRKLTHICTISNLNFLA